MDLIVAIGQWPLCQAIIELYRAQFNIIQLSDGAEVSAEISRVLQQKGNLLLTDRERNDLLHLMVCVRSYSRIPVVIINRRDNYLSRVMARFFNDTCVLGYDAFYQHIQRRAFHPLDLYFLPYSHGLPSGYWCWGEGSVYRRLNTFGLMLLYQQGVTLREAAVLISLAGHNSTAATARLLGIHEQAVVYCRRRLGVKLGLDHNRPDFISHIFLSPNVQHE